MKIKICVITGTRAEYGLLRLLMEGIKDSTSLELQLIATGMHLSPEFGLTYKAIEDDGFVIDKKIEMLLSSDTSVSISKSTALGLIGFADTLEELKPNYILLLGDRYELLAAASAALFARIPVIHLHGGETTEGAFDEAIRHSITKMSFIHCVAAEKYRERVIQLGESPDRVFNVGGLGIDNILKLKLLSKHDLENALNFNLGEKNFLITYHPVTLENYSSENQIDSLFRALDHFPNVHCIFTMPNSDTNSRVIFEKINNYTSSRKNAKAFTSLGQLRYLSCLQVADAVIGNSSSGIIEAPTFKVPTINLGDRQKGRLEAESVINCLPDHTSIIKAIEYSQLPEFQLKLKSVKNPYGDGGSTEKIIRILESLDPNPNLKKKFHDL